LCYGKTTVNTASVKYDFILSYSGFQNAVLLRFQTLEENQTELLKNQTELLKNQTELLRLVRSMVNSGGRCVAEQVEEDLLPTPLNTVEELTTLCGKLEDPVFKKQLVCTLITRQPVIKNTCYITLLAE